MIISVLADLKFSLAHCCVCGVVFCLPDLLNRTLQESKDVYYCPSGHRQQYPGKPMQERLDEARGAERETREQLWAAQAEANRKGEQLTKLRRKMKKEKEGKR